MTYSFDGEMSIEEVVDFFQWEFPPADGYEYEVRIFVPDADGVLKVELPGSAQS